MSRQAQKGDPGQIDRLIALVRAVGGVGLIARVVISGSDVLPAILTLSFDAAARDDDAAVAAIPAAANSRAA